MTTEPVITIKLWNHNIFPGEEPGERWGTFPDHDGSPVDYRTFRCYDDDGEWYFDAEVPVDDDEELPELTFNDFATCYGITQMKDVSRTNNRDLSMA